MNKLINTRFNDCLDTKKIREVVSVRPEPVGLLGVLDPPIAAQLLSNALEKIFLPNEFTLGFIKEMTARASLHNSKLFESKAVYVSGMYSPPEVEVL
ncbi:hypothetical protein AN403_4754 [Pseudomonas fluorescens]|uniref:Uncharacterized protein n=1 Tax=Pseudomonas fluorescens TaxID=294 RepID=A0A0P8X2U5_PSEFL|nr:hypothetical protein [Pseudomonas fluorescens]KPU60199.1 hypothetical protein AN403_4754 [Pseudomonas fluorescens]